MSKSERPILPDILVTRAAIAGVACAISSFILNPIDVTKIRMQNESSKSAQYEGMIQGMMKIYREEGLSGFRKGIVPSMLREISYSSIRMGAYDTIRDIVFHALPGHHDPKDDAHFAPPAVKFLSALLTGGIGSAIANPFDLVKTRFQAVLPGQDLPYDGSTRKALQSIYKMEGGIYQGL